MRECLREVLKVEASREAKRSQCLETDILYVSTGTKNEEGKYPSIVIEDEGRVHTLNSFLGEQLSLMYMHIHS